LWNKRIFLRTKLTHLQVNCSCKLIKMRFDCETFSACFCSLIILFFLYCQLSMGICRIKRRLDGRMWKMHANKASNTGKVAVITGANVGLGNIVALDLACRGCKTYVACRKGVANEPDPLTTVQSLRTSSGNGQVYFLDLDLSSMASVRRAARKLEENETEIHLLVNNAGHNSIGDN